ncbi:hypothetical protein HYX09_05185, partial [Candidatus Woesearchaeota archaeon]|nr:hypothetical protein [Candidatus Woesearchaeota archaeon]
AKSVPEGSELRMELKAEDPDGDAIKFSSDSLPEGARIEGNAFIWTPGFDAVQKSSVMDSIEDKLRILQETYVVSIAAESNGLSAKQDALIVVWDANRPPVLEVNDVTVKEGETVEIKPEYSDPDGQKVKISYSGWLDTGTYKTSFDDQGAYYVKVTASDGILETYRHVKVTVVDTNREPVFAPMQSQSVFENSTLQIRLLASDPDNDKMEFSVKNPPQNSKMDGNVFTWTPSYDFASNGSRSMDLQFEVSDGKSGAKSTAQIEVKDANRKPKILSAEPKQPTIKAGKPVTFEVNAIDEDNDELAYTWDFGLFDRYKGGSRHKRIFNSKGEKNVKVKVSDGIYETEHTWKIKVV